MKQSQLKSLIQSAMLLLAVIVLASCTNGAPKHARLIDKDALFVLSVNVKQASEKAELGENAKITAKLKDLLKDQGLSAETSKKLNAIVDDPAEAGIDLREPLLLFVDDMKRGEGGMVGALHDSGKFTELLKTLAKDGDLSAPEKVDGLNKMMIDRSLLVYNDEWFYINPQVYDEDKAFEYISERFKADEEQSILSREDFQEMCGFDGEAQMLVSGAFYEQSLGYSEREALKKVIPSEIDLADFSTLFDLSTSKGEAELTMKTFALTDNAKEYLKKNANWFKDVNGELIDYVPANSWFVAATNFTGEELYELIRPSLKESGDMSSEQLRDVRKMLASIDGDLTLCSSGLTEYGNAPKMLFLAQVTDDKMLDFVKDSYGWEKSPSGSYTMEGMTVGVKDGIFFFSNDESVSGLPAKKAGISASDFKGKPFYAVLSFKQLFNLQNVKDMINAESGAYENTVKEITGSLDKIEMWMEDGTTVKMRLKLTKDTNPLALIASLLEDFEMPARDESVTDYALDDTLGIDTAAVYEDEVYVDSTVDYY